MQEAGQWNDRTRRLLGDEAAERLAQLNVLVVGVGGVGGYAAEMLARSGVGRITLVDADTVGITNLNRQIIALQSTLGEPKVELMRRRIADINPRCEVTAIPGYLAAEDVDGLLSDGGFGFVADCIDTVGAKVALLDGCVRHHVKVISSMGAGGRLDPAKVRYADLWETCHDGLARAVRDRLKKMNRRIHIPVVCSYEAPRRASLMMDASLPGKQSSFGTVAAIPAIFGIYIAQYVINKTLIASKSLH